MKKRTKKNLTACLCAAACLSLLGSCKDDYLYDDEAPTWLNGSLYEFFEKNGEFKAYKALIDDLGYKDMLNRTGAVTLFLRKMRLLLVILLRRENQATWSNWCMNCRNLQKSICSIPRC